MCQVFSRKLPWNIISIIKLYNFLCCFSCWFWFCGLGCFVMVNNFSDILLYGLLETCLTQAGTFGTPHWFFMISLIYDKLDFNKQWLHDWAMPWLYSEETTVIICIKCFSNIINLLLLIIINFLLLIFKVYLNLACLMFLNTFFWAFFIVTSNLLMLPIPILQLCFNFLLV